MAPKQPLAGPSRMKPPNAQSAPPPSAVSAFNPSRTHFALALPVLGAADKVSIWDVSADHVMAEWEVEGASKVTTICWSSSPLPDSIPFEASVGTGKRKRRRKHGVGDGDEVLLITTAQGELAVFSPSRGEVLRKFELPAPVTAAWADERHILFTTTSAILVYDAHLSDEARRFALPANTPPPTAIAALSPSSPQFLDIIFGSLSVARLTLDLETSDTSSTSALIPVSTSSVTSLLPLPPASQGTSFLVVADDDRTVSQYTFTSPEIPAKLSYRYASPTLASAHSVAISSNLLSVLHTSGEISLFPMPAEYDLARPKTDSKPSVVKLVEGKDERISILCGAAFAPAVSGSARALLCGRMAGAGRVKWHRVAYESAEGGLRSTTSFGCDAQDLAGPVAATNVSWSYTSAQSELTIHRLYLFNASLHQSTSPKYLTRRSQTSLPRWLRLMPT